MVGEGTEWGIREMSGVRKENGVGEEAYED